MKTPLQVGKLPADLLRRLLERKHAIHPRLVLGPGIGLDCAVGLYAKALIATGLMDWPALIQRMTVGPASVIQRPLGRLTVGADADLTVIDPKARWTVDTSAFRSRSRNCPYHGWKLIGRPVATLVAGQVKFAL